jgi:hypothetical protein
MPNGKRKRDRAVVETPASRPTNRGGTRVAPANRSAAKAPAEDFFVN